MLSYLSLVKLSFSFKLKSKHFKTRLVNDLSVVVFVCVSVYVVVLLFLVFFGGGLFYLLGKTCCEKDSSFKACFQDLSRK